MLGRYVLTFSLVAFASMAPATFAQVSNGGGSAPDSAGSAAGGFQNVTTNFDGISVQVMNLVNEPGGEGGFRLVMRLTNSGDDERRLLFVRPASTLTDEMGNEYVAVASTGVAICTQRKAWDHNLEECRTWNNEAATRLAPEVPVTVSLRFLPAAEGFSKDLAALSQSLSLKSRNGYFSPDFSTATAADIIVNDIPQPR